MPSPFEQAMATADQTIQSTMMSEWLIGGKPYPAIYDEAPAVFEGLLSRDERAINGTARTLTLFRTSGYKPKLDDRVSGNGKKYLVKSYHFVDQLIVLQLE